MTYALQTMPRQLSGSVGGLLKREWNALRTRRAQRTTVRLLQGLNDVTLRDIGLTRGEIDSVVYGSPADRRVRFNSLG